MKKVNKTNMVRLAITNKKDFLYRAIEPYIKGEFLVGSISVEGIAYIMKAGAYGIVVSSNHGCNLSQSYTGQSFVLELPEYLLNEKGIDASQDFEDKVSRKEIFTEIDYNGRVKFYGI